MFFILLLPILFFTSNCIAVKNHVIPLVVSLPNLESVKDYAIVKYCYNSGFAKTSIKKRITEDKIEVEENPYSYKANTFITDSTQGLLFFDLTESKSGKWIDLALYIIHPRIMLLKRTHMQLDVSEKRHHINLVLQGKELQESTFEVVTLRKK